MTPPHHPHRPCHPVQRPCPWLQIVLAWLLLLLALAMAAPRATAGGSACHLLVGVAALAGALLVCAL